jgi:catechol 2,3-dioxygenase-like lactoylglutathione lyase family enzyme
LGWLLTELGWLEHQRWSRGVSWRLGSTYLVVEDSPDRRGDHDRMTAGLNHLALHVASPDEVDRLTEAAVRRGWTLLCPDRHPHAGGAHQHAAYLENEDGYEVELVATLAGEPHPAG